VGAPQVGLVMSLAFPVCDVCDRVEPVSIRVESNRVVARYACSALAQRPVLLVRS
jgi:hypothetical protein